MFFKFKRIILYIIVLFLMFTSTSCTMPTLRAISYKDVVYKLNDSEGNRFTYTNLDNEKIICTFNTNIFTYNSFSFELANDLYKVSFFNSSIRIVFPDDRIVTASFNDKNEINMLSASRSSAIYESDFEIVMLAQNIYAARGIKYIGWNYILIIVIILFLGIMMLNIRSNGFQHRTYNYNRNVRGRTYYGRPNYKRSRTHYKNRNMKHNVHANSNKKWYNKEVKTKNSKAYYIIVNLFILALIGVLVFVVFYMNE